MVLREGNTDRKGKPSLTGGLKAGQYRQRKGVDGLVGEFSLERDMHTEEGDHGLPGGRKYVENVWRHVHVEKKVWSDGGT